MVEKTSPDRILRLAALLHDIGKPKTRSIGPEGVSFHHHEVVGARMADTRLRALRYPMDEIADITRLVELHLRFHGFGTGWSDSAVRRYARDAGPLLEKLNELTRCDCTTRNQRRAEELARRMDVLEERIAELREQEELDAIRPDLDGNQIMEHLGIGPSRAVGQARDFLLELRLEEGPLGEEEALRRLDAWWASPTRPLTRRARPLRTGDVRRRQGPPNRHQFGPSPEPVTSGGVRAPRIVTSCEARPPVARRGGIIGACPTSSTSPT